MILGGTRLEGIVAAELLAEGFLRANKGVPAAMQLVNDTIASTPLDTLATVRCPILVPCGEDDNENGSATALAEAVPSGH
ncbi:hypothetical protein [Sphingomonas phyllosphaerae]|uniref:hypothetical protein n=1 Tax=Sphingomonas phyllosphaerae TaxID=257003 RepID=UPI0024138BE0|nr:hypothetical protein [Sphingomonas phyllosphaerae]